MSYKKQKQNSIALFGVCILFLFFLFGSSATAQYITSTSFQIENPILIDSGGISTSTSFKHVSSTGELVIGESTATSFIGQTGWLYFPEAEPVADAPGPSSGGGGAKIDLPFIPGLVCERFADLNCDNSVNIIDFSILLFYFDKDDQQVIETYDLSGNESVDFLDVSVMFFHWDV